MKNVITYLLFSFILLFSCTAKISPKEASWNPYEIGDNFTFENEEGASKAFEVSKIETQLNKENVYAGNLSRKKESMVVFAKQMEPTMSEDFALLVISADVNSDTSLGLTLSIPDQLEANYFEDISKISTEGQLTIKGILYENVMEVNPNLSVGEAVSTPYPVKLYFSKEVGYLGYDLSNGEKWRLR